MQNTNSHQHPPHRLLDLGSEQESHQQTLTFGCCILWQEPTCAWRGISGRMERLRSTFWQVPIHTVAFVAPTSVHTPSSMPALAGNLTLIYVLRPIQEGREKQKGEKGWTLWQPFLLCGGGFNFLFCIEVKPSINIVIVSSQITRPIWKKMKKN